MLRHSPELIPAVPHHLRVCSREALFAGDNLRHGVVNGGLRDTPRGKVRAVRRLRVVRAIGRP